MVSINWKNNKEFLYRYLLFHDLVEKSSFRIEKSKGRNLYGRINFRPFLAFVIG